MRRDWMPLSAAAMVTGSLALLLGVLLLPRTGGNASALMLVREDDGRWLVVAILFSLAALGLLLGLPCLLSLFPRRGRRTGLVGIGLMTMAGAGTYSFGMLLIFVRALVLADALREGAFEAVGNDVVLGVMLQAWVLSFYLAELALAIAVLRAETVPRWMPLVLMAHVATLPLGPVLPDGVSGAAVLLTVVALSGLAITANANEADRRPNGGRLVAHG